MKGRDLQVGMVVLKPEDTAAMVRIFMTATPLVKDDVRLLLIEEIRSSTVREDRPSGLRWIVLGIARLCGRIA